MWSQPPCFFLGAGGHPPVWAFRPFPSRLCSSSYREVSPLLSSLSPSQCSGQRAPRERRIMGPLYMGCGGREASALGQLPVTPWCVAASAADWLRGAVLLWGPDPTCVWCSCPYTLCWEGQRQLPVSLWFSMGACTPLTCGHSAGSYVQVLSGPLKTHDHPGGSARDMWMGQHSSLEGL